MLQDHIKHPFLHGHKYLITLAKPLSFVAIFVASSCSSLEMSRFYYSPLTLAFFFTTLLSYAAICLHLTDLCALLKKLAWKGIK